MYHQLLSINRPPFLCYILSLLLILVTKSIAAQPLLNGSRNAVLASSSIALPGTRWPEVNPSSMAAIEQSDVAFFATEGYGLSELRSSAANFVFPTQNFVYGVMAQVFGYEAYRELKFATTISRTVHFNSSREILIGISALLKRINIRHIGHQSEAGFRAGLTVEIWPAIYMGASTKQVFKSVQTKSMEDEFQIGLGFSPTNTFTILIAVLKEISHPPSLSVGIESSMKPGMTLRSGMSTHPFRIAMGLDLHIKKLEIGVLAERHIILNWTPAISIALHT